MKTKIRRCKICGKRLSIYNKSDQCFCHSFDPDLGEPDMGIIYSNGDTSYSDRPWKGIDIVNRDYYGDRDGGWWCGY